METVASQFAPTLVPDRDPDHELDPSLEQAAAQGRYIRIRDWVSDYLPTPRDIFIYLPEAYLREPARRFPVLLLHDGQNVFDGNLAYVPGHSWRAATTADVEIAAGRVEPLILVGVANTGTERMAEYTPTPDRRLGGGKGSLYARLLIEELLPIVRQNYRTLPGPQNTGIAGSSLGGLISLAIGLRHPEIFGRIGALSPSIWWDNRSILADVRALPDAYADAYKNGDFPLPQHLKRTYSQQPERIWLDMGTAEGIRHVRDADLLAKLLQQKGWSLNDNLHYEHVPDGLHNEDAWADRFGNVLAFLFPSREEHL